MKRKNINSHVKFIKTNNHNANKKVKNEKF